MARSRPTRVARILRQACESLEEAHDSGLVHRDIKPANIHLGRVGRQDDFVKVLDFGLVKSVAASGDDSLASVAGVAVGTPAYMAPEMARGEAPWMAGPTSIRSGCVAYYLLTGQLVFAGETPIQTVLLHVQREPVPPSSADREPRPTRARAAGPPLPGEAAGRPAAERRRAHGGARSRPALRRLEAPCTTVSSSRRRVAGSSA